MRSANVFIAVTKIKVLYDVVKNFRVFEITSKTTIVAGYESI